MALNVKAKLTLDSAQFDTGMKKSGELATATARAQEKAAREAAQAQAFAAKLAGDSVKTQSLRIVEARKLEAAASRDLRTAQTIAKKGYLDEAEAAKVEAAALQRLTAAKFEAAEASKKTSLQRAGLTLREHFEGLSIGGAIGESLTGAAEALALTELISKLKEAVSSSLEFGEAIQRASEKTGLAVSTLSTLHYAAGVTGGDFEAMSAAVAKMDKAIGEATEGNKKAQAFIKALGLDARQLADSPNGAEIAFKKFAATLSATENPIRRVELATALLGKAGADQIPTLIELGNNWDEFRQKAEAAGVQLNGDTAASLAATNEKLKEMEQKIRGAGLAFTEGLAPGINAVLGALSGGSGTFDAIRDFAKDISKYLAESVYDAESLASTLARVGAFAAKYDPFPVRGNASAAADAIELQKKADEYQKRADDAHFLAQTGFERGAKEPTAGHPGHPQTAAGAGSAFEGVGDLTGAANKAAEERLKAFEAELNQERLNGQLSVNTELQFWEDKIDAFTKGSDQYNAVLAKEAELEERLRREFHEKIVKFQEQQKHLPTDTEGQQILARSSEFFTKDAQRRGAIQDEDIVDTNKASLLEAQNTAREQEAKLTDEAGRSMTRYAAAIELAKVHAKEFADELTALEAIRNTRALRAGLDPSKENNRALAESQAAIAELQSRRQIQVQQDSDAIYGRETSAIVGATDALDDFIRKTQDSATTIYNFTTTTLNGLNAELVRGLSGQKTSFGNFGAGVARNVAGIGLEKVEGNLLSLVPGLSGLLPKKKPTGSAGDPVHVVLDNSPNLPGLPGGANIGALIGAVSGAFQHDAQNGGIQTTDSVLNNLIPLESLPPLPGFASGGVISPGTWALVGEEGPEPIYTGSSGATVLPNSMLKSGGGDTTHNWNIDARGATDPAAVNAAVQRGIMQAMPQILSASVSTSRELAARRPTTVR